MRDNWKLLVTITVALIVLVMVGLRVKQSFAPYAPASLNYAQHTSPGFFFQGDLRRSWKNVEAVVKLARQEERATLLHLANITFLQICKLPNDALVWDTVEMRNPGFAPLSRVERRELGPPAKLIGYYTLEGKPLGYDTKTDLRTREHTLTTVSLADPLEAGKSILFFRVYRTASRVNTNQPGKGVVNLGRLPVSNSQLHITGLAVPLPAVVEKSSPAGGAIHTADGVTVATWVSPRIDSPNRNVQVTFAVAK